LRRRVVSILINKGETMKTLLILLAWMMPLHVLALGKLADLQIYDRTEGRRPQVWWHEGRAYVAGRPGNEYQVALRNPGGREVLAVVSVDGVNVITGETANPSQSGYVVAPGRALEVRGWRKNLAETAAFYFTSLPNSYAARTARPEHVGVIGVALFNREMQPQEIAPPLAKSQAEDRVTCPTRQFRACYQRSGRSPHAVLRQPS
jgi:hypothetical protein